MSQKYFCNLSECMKLMLPPGTSSKELENRMKEKTGNFVYLAKFFMNSLSLRNSSSSPAKLHNSGIINYKPEFLTASMENVANALTSYFNKLGAVKQLTFLDRDFFYKEMDEHISEFMATPIKKSDETEEEKEW